MTLLFSIFACTLLRDIVTLPFFFIFACILLRVSAFRVFTLSFCAFLPCCSVLYRVCVRGGGVRSPGEVGVLVHPPLGECVKALCVIVLMVAQHCTQLGSLALKQKTYLTREALCTCVLLFSFSRFSRFHVSEV